MAAAVLSACPGRKSKSQENLKYSSDMGVSKNGTEDDNYVLELLAQLPPSRELLKHYQVIVKPSCSSCSNSNNARISWKHTRRKRST